MGANRAMDLPVVRRVVVAAPRGFCAGVVRAIESVERALEAFGPPVYLRRQIVHNEHVTDELETRGAVFVESEEDVSEGALLVLAAHGVPSRVHRRSAERGLRMVDATCLFVTKVHAEARRFAREGFHVVLVGHAGRDEVVGTMGQAPESNVLVETVADEDELDEAMFDDAEAVGVTAGASTPEELVQRILAWFSARGVPEIRTSAAHSETVSFSLPAGL
jgi:4-hydroxy-3-methylbut-2-en-1-yl diphosphate reductase